MATAETKRGWDDIDLGEESFDDTEISDADSMGRTPAGRYHCVCVESVPHVRTDKSAGHDYIGVSLQWKVLKAFKIEGKDIPEDKQDDYEGWKIWDEVRMEYAGEKEGWKKRRIFVAKRLGLITEENKSLTKESWAKGVLGKEAILTCEDQEYEDSMGMKKTIKGKVAFSGYEAVGSEQKIAPPTDTYDDI